MKYMYKCYCLMGYHFTNVNDRVLSKQSNIFCISTCHLREPKKNLNLPETQQSKYIH